MRRRRKASRFQPAARKPYAGTFNDMSHSSGHAMDPGPSGCQMVSTEPQCFRDAQAFHPSQGVPQHAVQHSYMPAQQVRLPSNSSSLGAVTMDMGNAPPEGFLAKLAQYRSS